MKITWEPKDARLGSFVRDRLTEAVFLIGYIYEQRSYCLIALDTKSGQDTGTTRVMGDKEAVVQFLNKQDMVPHGEIKW